MTYYDEPSGKFYYPVRCDKHDLKGYDYCEMCMLRSQVQDAVENARKNTQSTLAQTHLAIQVLNDCFFKLQKQLDELSEHYHRYR